jgi:hypothetical protein
MPRPIAKDIKIANKGTRAKKGHPGKWPLRSKKAVNRAKMMEKFTTALSTTMVGRQNLGKLIFFKR